jgi:hypothetical protein
MATYEIIENNAPYYKIAVRFGRNRFEQSVIAEGTAEEAAAKLQKYADDYERDWDAMIEANQQAEQSSTDSEPTENP